MGQKQMDKCLRIGQYGDIYVEYKIKKSKWLSKTPKKRRKYEKKQLLKALRKGHIFSEPVFLRLNRMEGKSKHKPLTEPDTSTEENDDDDSCEFTSYEKEEATKSADTWECSVCFEDKPIDHFYLQNECPHKFCKDCIRDYLESEIKDRKVLDMKCPGSDCSRRITQLEIDSLLGRSEVYGKYEQFTLEECLTQDPNFVYCPTPNCGNGMVIADGLKITCGNCKTSFCAKCKKEYHEGKTCEESGPKTNEERQTNKKIEKLIRKNKAKYCLGCKNLVLKNKGCNHMTCKCGFEFCWRCYEVYSKRHNKCMFKKK